MSRTSRAGLPVVCTVAATVTVLVATLLPWLRSGSAVRNAYALTRSAAIVGVIDGWSRRALPGVVYALPFLVAATWTAGAVGRRGATALLGGIVGAGSIVAGITVTAQTTPELGPIAAIIAGAGAVGTATWLARSGEQEIMTTRGEDDDRV